MQIDFIFQHNRLSVTELQSSGVRSLNWLEELIADEDTQFNDITAPTDSFPVYVAIGFCAASVPLLYIFERDGEMIRSLFARVATKREIITEFCPYCRK